MVPIPTVVVSSSHHLSCGSEAGSSQAVAIEATSVQRESIPAEDAVVVRSNQGKTVFI